MKACTQAISVKANIRMAHVKDRASFSCLAHMARSGRSQNRLHTQKALMEFLLLRRVKQ
jgi:hypothetical protein